MPSGPHRRKSTKKKKKAKSNAPHSPHGVSDDDQHNSPHPEVKVEDSEGGSSGYESLTPVTTQKSAKEKLSKIEIDKPRNSPKQANFKIDKAAMMELEPPTVVDYLCQPFEFSPEETQKANDLGFKTPTFVDPVEPFDQSLVEVASELNNDTKFQQTDDLAVAETQLELTFINEINKPPNSAEQAKIKINKPAMMELEPPTVADYLSQPFKSSPEKETHKVEDLGFKTPTFADPVEFVDQSLVEVASQLNNDTKVQEKDELAAAETRLEEHTVINEPDYLSKENEVQKLESPKLKENLLQDSTNGKCPYCGRSGDDERQPLLASAPRPPEKASWKNCCGLFELFSGSTRN